MTTISVLLALSGALTVFAIASAIVARQGAYEARAALRRTQNDIHELMLELDRVRAAIRRIEGRQTARSGGEDRAARPTADSVTPGGLPDPTRDPEKWRAAVRLLGLTQAATRNLSRGNTVESSDEFERGTVPADRQRNGNAPEAPIGGGAGDQVASPKTRGRPARSNGEGKRSS